MKKLLFALPVFALLAAGCNANQSATSYSSSSSVKNVSVAPTQASTTRPSWVTYSNPKLGFSIDYPNDGTYKITENQGNLSIKAIPVNGYSISIMQPGNLFTPSTISDQESFLIDVTPDPNILTSLPASLELSASTKNINGLTYKQLIVDPNVLATHPLLHNYAYVVQHGGQYYVFESIKGPDDLIFEHMMTTVNFNK